MGDALNRDVLAAFVDELNVIDKEAGALDAALKWGQRGLKGVGTRSGHFGSEMGEIGRRVFSPAYGLREGWRQMTPRAMLRGSKALQKAPLAGEARKEMLEGGMRIPFTQTKVFKAGKHLGEHTDKAQSLAGIAKGQGIKGSRLKALAEELSRRGWTGKGDITKYMPVGGKGMVAGFGAMGAADVARAPKATATGEGGAVERGLGEVGSGLGWIAGAGLGIPGMLGWAGAQYAGGKLGRIIDRARAGANPRQALLAPSPEEASEQLGRIQEFYGQPR
jgi:hypothetical protein